MVAGGRAIAMELSSGEQKFAKSASFGKRSLRSPCIPEAQIEAAHGLQASPPISTDRPRGRGRPMVRVISVVSRAAMPFGHHLQRPFREDA